ncbi:MAG: DUF262 domain-containing protein [Desulfovibrio sp.]|nr:DUF262 domain-containing protein [Desulfovibrio sp.]
MDFKVESKTIQDALSLNRKYIIPRFQREYSWEKEHFDELWNDIINNLQYINGKIEPSEYFIGTIVLAGDESDASNIDRYIVDGQQRLMTITIIFSVLSHIFHQIGEEQLRDSIHRYIISLDENGSEYTKLVNEAAKPFFQKKIQKKESEDIDPQTIEDRHIFDAYKFFSKQLSEPNLVKIFNDLYYDNNLNYIGMLKIFRDQILRCKIVYVTVKDFADAYTIFEVLNAKGKELAPLDIIKNIICSVVNTTEPIDDIDESWKKIKGYMADCNVDITAFFRHFWLSKYNFTTNKRLVSDFKSKIDKNIDIYKDFISSLEDAAHDYRKIAFPRQDDWNCAEERHFYKNFKALNIFNVTQVRSLLLSLLYLYRNKKIRFKQFKEFIDFLEYFHFIFSAICSSRASGLERRYSSFARKLYNANDKSEVKTYLTDLQILLQNDLPSLEYFKEKIQEFEYIPDKKIQR